MTAQLLPNTLPDPDSTVSVIPINVLNTRIIDLIINARKEIGMEQHSVVSVDGDAFTFYIYLTNSYCLIINL